MTRSRGALLAFVALSAAGLNLALLLLPSLILHGSSSHLLINGKVASLLALASLFFLADASSLLYSATDRMSAAPVDRRQYRLALLTGVLLWGTMSSGLADPSRWLLSIPWLGALLMVAGACLRLASIRQLRQQFTSSAVVQPKDRTLVQSGIFRLVRHPSEVGLLAFAFGAAFFLGSAVALLGAGALVATALLRIRWEDEQLALAWPEEFAEYRCRVSALFPLCGSTSLPPVAKSTGPLRNSHV